MQKAFPCSPPTVPWRHLFLWAAAALSCFGQVHCTAQNRTVVGVFVVYLGSYANLVFSPLSSHSLNINPANLCFSLLLFHSLQKYTCSYRFKFARYVVFMYFLNMHPSTSFHSIYFPRIPGIRCMSSRVILIIINGSLSLIVGLFVLMKCCFFSSCFRK